MRPLPPRPPRNHYGIVHTAHVTKEQADEVARILKIPEGKKKYLTVGTEIHIVREAKESELAKEK